MNNKVIFKVLLTVLVSLQTSLCDVQLHNINPTMLTPTKTIGECQACKVLVDSFKKGLELTKRGKFEGGDAAWEEEKLKTYKRSEIRLVEIQESLCKEATEHSVQCHHMAELAEEHIEEWWSGGHEDSEDLITYFCIEKLKFCCPKLHYGKECLPCKGNLANLCNGNGKCRGDGTRKGNGTCLCDIGYGGDNCDTCAFGYYVSYQDDKKLLCSPCHISCQGDCTVSTPKGCVACKPGWIFDSEEGCEDVNECSDKNKCAINQFCVNQEGSYSCLNCDKSCVSCYGDGPDLCHKCAKGYSKKGELCIADREDEDNTDKLTYTRYMTYVGLLIATAILLPKSPSLGGMVGFLVLSYIVAAEYYCMINGHSQGIVDLKNFDLSQLFRS